MAFRPPGTLPFLSLLAACVGGFIFAHDFVAAGIVVPEIQDHFSASLGSAQWVITGFSIAIALSVVPAGRLADVYGAGRIFVAGAFAFAAASLLVALAPELWFLLAARALEGIAGGFLWISAITLVFDHYGPPRAAAAGALVVFASGLGLALGPVDAGLLIEWLGWRAAFVFNIPICLFVGLVILRHRSEHVRGKDRSIDWTGVELLAAALVALLVTLRYAPEWGWGSAEAIVGFFVSLALFVVFVLQQRAWGYRALVPPDIAANRTLAVALAGEALLTSSYFIAISFAPQVFANVLGADPIESGLMQMPTMAAFALGGVLTGVIFTGLPPSLTAIAGGAVSAVGGLVLALMPDDPGYLALLPGLLLIGLGVGSLLGALLTIGISALPEERKGLASGLLYTAQLAGGAIVLAAATAVATGVAEGASDDGFEGVVQGAQSAFLFGVAVAAIGILAAILGFRAAAGGATASVSSPSKPSPP
jgi:EmrB/QacA subfamily drug resistance transporter